MSELPANRVEAPDPATATARQRDVMDRLIAKRGKVLIPYKIWLHAPGVAEGMEALGTHLNTASSLSAAERELVVLATVVHWDSPFPIRGHTKHALAAGLPPEIVDGLIARRPVAPEAPRLAAIARLTAASLAGQSTDDAAFDNYATQIGREGMAEVVALIGYFTAVALAMRLHDVRPKPE